MPKQTPLIKLPKGTVLPDHIAIVLDGNRRWARAHGLPSIEGHKAGFMALKTIIKAVRGLGIHTLSVWGFSTENWDRPEPEVDKIMSLVAKAIQEVIDEADSEGVRFIHLGRKDRLPKRLLDLITKAEELTKNNRKYILNVALDYGGRDELLRATKKIIDDGVPVDKIDQKLFGKYLDTAGQPYPNVDLFIRTSGEQRTSGFLPWQLDYAEYYWERDHLPDMSPEKLRTILLDYSRRRRRFGGNDAVSHLSFKPEVTAKFELAWWRLANIPEGTKFADYAKQHIKEQFGLSTKLAGEAAKYMLEGLQDGKRSKWKKANKNIKAFYNLLKEELKLAFEPSLVTSIDVKLLQKTTDKDIAAVGDIEDLSRSLVAEVYRISDFQAAKAGHLRALATVERQMAERGMGEQHWAMAQDYLEKYYKALKDRVA